MQNVNLHFFVLITTSTALAPLVSSVLVKSFSTRERGHHLSWDHNWVPLWLATITISTQKAIALAGVAIKRAREHTIMNTFLLLSVILTSALCGRCLFLADENITGGQDYLIKPNKRSKMEDIEGQFGRQYIQVPLTGKGSHCS
jgi:hypothetical protein